MNLALAIFILIITVVGFIVLGDIISFHIKDNLEQSTVYGYNLTRADIEEGRVLELCIAGITLSECKFIYGGPLR